MSWLLDTVVISELRTSRANPGVVAWAEERDPLALWISSITVLELDLGVRRKERSDPEQGVVLRRWCDSVLATFSDRTLPFDPVAATATAGLHVPDRRPERDAMIAGIASSRGLTIVTRNEKDFAPMGVAYLNPWTT